MIYMSDAEYDRLKAEHPEISEVCPTCHGKDSYFYLGRDHKCDCLKQNSLNLKYLKAGIGLTYQRLDWLDVKIPREQLTPIHDWLNNAESYINQGIGLFLSGSLGTGKTMLCALILKDLIKQGYDCYMTTFSETVEAFAATWGNDQEKQRFAKRFKTSRVLGLDDLGKEFRSSNRLSPTTFDMILRTRVQNSRPTILTTNLTAKELQRGYGSAVLSMLVEKSIEVILTGDDFRPQAHDRLMDEVKKGEVRPIV